MQSILKDQHLAEPVGVVPCVHGEELPAVVGEGEDVDLVPADGHQLVPLHPHRQHRVRARELQHLAQPIELATNFHNIQLFNIRRRPLLHI